MNLFKKFTSLLIILVLGLSLLPSTVIATSIDTQQVTPGDGGSSFASCTYYTEAEVEEEYKEVEKLTSYTSWASIILNSLTGGILAQSANNSSINQAFEKAYYRDSHLRICHNGAVVEDTTINMGYLKDLTFMMD